MQTTRRLLFERQGQQAKGTVPVAMICAGLNPKTLKGREKCKEYNYINIFQTPYSTQGARPKSRSGPLA